VSGSIWAAPAAQRFSKPSTTPAYIQKRIENHRDIAIKFKSKIVVEKREARNDFATQRQSVTRVHTDGDITEVRNHQEGSKEGTHSGDRRAGRVAHGPCLRTEQLRRHHPRSHLGGKIKEQTTKNGFRNRIE